MSDRRRRLLLAAPLAAAFARPARAADRPVVDQTRRLGTLLWTGEAPAASTRTSAVARAATAGTTPDARLDGLKVRAGGGPVWAMFHLVAVLDGASSRAEALFSAMPTDTPVRAGDDVLQFAARNMHERHPGLDPGASGDGFVTPLSGTRLRSRVSAQGFGERIEALRSARLVHGVMRRSYAIPGGESVSFSAGLLRASGMRPLWLDVVLAQGPSVREMDVFERAVNGAWWSRHTTELAILGTVAVGGGLALRALRR